uniref:thrombomodulin-like n=1 Tax=Doryrhamphus excisus TaxID=161450 RepID=UPI0025AE9F03|nr:thrombomodulin-like [Doryrhamphus excisus]
MEDVTGLLVAVLLVLAGRLGGTEPNGGSCFGKQCYAVHRRAGDFTSAQNQCKEQNGHLMTVGSQSTHDALVALLGNASGHFWIGLHRPIRCPDATLGLKGYEWVTEDGESVFNNWAETFDRSCSSPRCVTVSAEDGFRWTQKRCDARVSGFLCAYSFDYACTRLNEEEAAGEYVIYTNPLGLGEEGLHSLPPGSTAIRMPSELKHVCFFQKWLQAPWSCEIFQGGCEHKCIAGPDHQPSCYCPPGLSIHPVNKVTCEEDPDGPCTRLGCEHACLEDPHGAHLCMCGHGFELASDGRSCVDFNDCTDERQCPGENFRCVDTAGGYRCVCEDGFKLTGGVCVDQDECASAPCEHMCHNTPGSYRCSCYEGYIEDTHSANTCKLHCGKEECKAECDPNDQYQCFCPDGYIAEERLDGTVCIDMDECAFAYCEHRCKNTYGSFKCSCRKGFALVDEVFCKRKSEDEDEEWEGSGEALTSPSASTLTPNVGPTGQPSAVTVGGLVGIIVCCVFVVVLVVFLAQHLLKKRGKMEREATLKASGGGGGEAHSLHKMEVVM